LSGVNELPKQTCWWPPEWKSRLQELAASLRADGMPDDDADRAAESKCRSEHFTEEMRLLKERVPKVARREEPRPFWLDRYD